MLSTHYTELLFLHVCCVALSGGLFLLRGVLRASGSMVANAVALRFVSYGIDTVLLTAALLLTLIVHQYPFVNDWLTVKVLLLLLYIMLGSFALKRARTRTASWIALTAAIMTFGMMVGVAITHRPAGWLTLLQ